MLRCGILLLLWALSVEGHGFMTQPVARNVMANGQQGFWNMMSLNRAGSGGICGGQSVGDNRFSAGGIFATRHIVATYKQGQQITIGINVWSNHYGYFQMSLCPLKGVSNRAEQTQLSQGCLNKHVLHRADGTGTKTFLTQGGWQYTLTAEYVLPPGVTCQRCVLQWRWVTGHMCWPPGVSLALVAQYNSGLLHHPCPANFRNPYVLRPEKFFNCADIHITH